MTDKVRISRLPKWARELIESQAATIESQADSIKILSGETPGGALPSVSVVRLDVPDKMHGPGVEIPLPTDAPIRFRLGEGENQRVDLYRPDRFDTLVVIGGGPLKITPGGGSNCIAIKVDP